MAMDFWEAQRRAKKKTGIYLFIFALLTFSVAFAAEIAMRHFASQSYNPNYPLIGIIFICITFAVAAGQYLLFKGGGGSYVAESVGAELVDPQTTDPVERRLLNIVQEIAIASSLPVPPVYILQADQINAFAAGLAPHDAAITVTEGTLNLLNRDELQGVVAHEFGHIYNGDMKISLRLAAMVMGFFFVLYIALRMLQFGRFSSRDEKRGGNPVMIAALIFLVAGAFTWFAGKILQACVSREREYLADACAVQFTRNPNGIANALKKILQMQQKEDMPKEGMAISHLYFDDHTALSSLFASHPPLEKRIAALEGREYIPEEWHIPNNQ